MKLSIYLYRFMAARVRKGSSFASGAGCLWRQEEVIRRLLANDDVIELYMPLKTVVWPFVIVNIIEMIFKGLWDAKLDACVLAKLHALWLSSR
ncbi:predicted protein [Chaetomium globosum CBS 148.51]|uniref:Uncharacterized protein n=1 Tax=Chaetomium globosum (strain ATCC 6205 / CBS 148.51 / DSM 1962 / NBRC 6347 / NRRL 1970) TaxID=306901 RepID=Q2GN35_CHAGB|nr:uncharacterized protein CHGG_10619 [Chaetomium globosum CBS 148.51]EAQ84215.1 predicted protein [Chaetomium globosum CBS 148.51]